MVYAQANTAATERSLFAPAFSYPASFNYSETADNGTSATPEAPGPATAEDGLTSGEVAALALAFGAVWLVSVLGNALVCLVIHRSRRTQSTTNYFVVAIACADLLLSVGGAPVVLAQVAWGRWPLGAAACAAARYVQHLCPGLQVYVLLSISVDRFYTIVYPLSFKVSREKAKMMILASCLLDGALVAPCLFFYGAAPADPRHCHFFLPDSRGAASYAAAHLLLGFALPAGLIVSFYRRVVRHIWRIGAGGLAVRRTVNPVPRAKVKTIKMFLVLNWLFFLTWTPFYLAQLWHPREEEGGGGGRRRGLLFFAAVTWISFSSTASKPTLYSVYNANFRRGMQETFCMSSIKCYRSNAYTITASSRLAKKNYVGVADAPVGAKDESSELDPKDKKLAWTASAHNTTFV
ncbi:probable G-protein coupled receptor 19 [Syngnathoides biaculeatus]|uniref:probable G-protein coupled receptor 19 n=1 Tax=Syngnathoides biaculeatus TaxID=300417 RepID=UPI002ADD5AA2|nr:probable G-protein coupled receptor 19 [Syngnathoides biaculeatus]XP_061662316.1 probable G-protein coupled receptor 19 [Syngnathoides biaculeatus]